MQRESLTSVTIPASVTTIEDGAFSYSQALVSATFQGNAPTAGYLAFGN